MFQTGDKITYISKIPLKCNFWRTPIRNWIKWYR